ncbi:MAG: peptide-methionine (S)-S-oxide reductase MsrA [Firmicutes bacterium]|nr:peptide-methionine (S)-S-oxide reductase MsrA [Bacillota bacterium]
MAEETAILGGGCFWCLEAIFGDLKGVRKVNPGYAGGLIPNPTYQQVSRGDTGHAEVVQVVFNPETISFRELLEIFFSVHDPTTLNRQGNDVGSQYRSVIFYQNEVQKDQAEEVTEEAALLWPDPLVTELEPLKDFYPAEPYHRNYFHLNKEQNYCRFVIAPKLAAFRGKFASKLRS